jgi:hypothetical protein
LSRNIAVLSHHIRDGQNGTKNGGSNRDQDYHRYSQSSWQRPRSEVSLGDSSNRFRIELAEQAGMITGMGKTRRVPSLLSSGRMDRKAHSPLSRRCLRMPSGSTRGIMPEQK